MARARAGRRSSERPCRAATRSPTASGASARPVIQSDLLGGEREAFDRGTVEGIRGQWSAGTGRRYTPLMRRSLLVPSGFALLALLSPVSFTTGCTHGSAADGSGTGTAPPPEDPSVPLVESRAKGVVIATLQTHDKRVAILGRMIQVANGTTDPKSLRVVVHTNDGALVADGLTIAELQRVDPTLHALVTSAVADGTYLDATLHDGYRLDHDRHDVVQIGGAGAGNGSPLLGPSR